MGYIIGVGREQVVMFPPTIDEYIEEASVVRAVWALAEFLDLKELGFVRAEPDVTGRPGYDPRMMLGVYLWGYLNKVRTSRMIERECKRNVELIWLTGNLRPDFKTIANFRCANRKALKKVMVQFRMWCKDEGLYGGEEVSVDGSKFEAVNANKRNYTRTKLEKRIEAAEAEAEKYLEELSKADEAEVEETEKQLTVKELNEKRGRIKERLARYSGMMKEMDESGEDQVSLTDKDARMMKTGRGSDVCYNPQVAVDGKHKLIVDFEMTNAVADQGQLAVIAKKAKEALCVEELKVVADAGYFDGASLKECEEAGIETYVPVPNTDKGEKNGLFAREEFQYDEQKDEYVCPQGEELKPTSKRSYENGREVNIYTTKACGSCPLRAQCTPSKQGKRIERWVDEEVMVRQRERNQQNPGIMKRRKELSEHPFGTIKRAMDAAYFLMRGKDKVEAEFSLTVVCYNFKRVMTILGIEKLIEMLRARTARAIGYLQTKAA
jgi:transposase